MLGKRGVVGQGSGRLSTCNLTQIWQQMQVALYLLSRGVLSRL